MTCMPLLGVILVDDIGVHIKYVQLANGSNLPGLGVLLEHLISWLSPFMVIPQQAKDFFSPVATCSPETLVAGLTQ